MAATSFSAVSWSPTEIITDEKMQQFSDNVQWVYENTPRAIYTNNFGHVKPTGVKLLSGMTAFPPDPGSNYAQYFVGFGNTFSVGCYPVVTTGLMTLLGPRGLGVTITAHNNTVQPDQTGMYVILNRETGNRYTFLTDWVVVNWIAMGY